MASTAPILTSNELINETKVEVFQTDLDNCYSSEQQNENVFYLTTEDESQRSIAPTTDNTDWSELNEKEQSTTDICEEAAPNLSPQVAVHDESELLDLQYADNFW